MQPQANTEPYQQAAPTLNLRVSPEEFLNDTFARAKGMDDAITATEGEDMAAGTDPLPEGPPTAAFGGSDPGALGGAAPAMSEQDAAKHTRTLMDMRETGQALLIAQIADGKLDDYKQYYYAAWQKELLIEAWTPLVQSAGITVNPWIKVLYAEGISTGPLLALTIKNRKQRIENELLRAQLRKSQQQQAESEEVRISDQKAVNSSIPAPPGVQTRYDIKTLWKVDSNGFFEFNTDKVRIPIPHRKVKPVLTPENYALLCKHNGKENIDRIFKINE